MVDTMQPFQLILAFLVGTLLNFAFQTLGRAILVNRKVDIHFWLGATLLTGAAYTVCQLLLSITLPEATLLTLHRMKLAFLLVTITGWVFCVYSIYFPKSLYPRFFAVVAGTVMLLVPFNIFLHAPVTSLNIRLGGVIFSYHYGTTGPAYLLMALLVLVLFSLLPVLRFLTARELSLGSRLMGALSFSPGLIGGLNDFAVTGGRLHSIMISEYVFFIFLAAISVYISNEDAKTVKRLANLNNELEERIRERTNELEASNQKLQAMATTDMLTGLYNRHQFVQILTCEEDRIERYQGKEGNSFALLFIDLDNFKYYNDNFGHAVGDLVLKLFAELLRKTLRTSDTAGRYGGDEFLILLPNTPESDALKLAHRILEKVESAKGYIDEITALMGRDIVLPQEQYLGCSIGLTSYDIASGQTGEDLLSAADQALYEAKSAGKHCVKIWRGRESAVSVSCL
jgi:diguanylate cyclase (GGDEF)-like protein